MTHSQFTELYNQNLPALKNFARKLTRDEDAANDLVQDAMIKAFRAKDKFLAKSSFKSWTFTILKNTFITGYNKRRKRGIVSTPIEELAHNFENSHAINNNAISLLYVKEIRSRIGKLSEKCKEPFRLHLSGYQYNEIAEALQIPIGTVKSRINFARTKLKQMMSNDIMVAA